MNRSIDISLVPNLFMFFYRYDEFHEQQDQVVSTYPDMIQTEISIYDDSVCDFFGVHRQATAKVIVCGICLVHLTK